MKKILSLLLAGMLLSFAACEQPNNNSTSQGNSSVSTSESSVGELLEIPEGYTRYDIGESNGKKTQGFGAQFDTHFFRSDYGNLTDAEMELVFERCREMNLQNIRTQLFPEWYERGNDNDDPDVFDFDSKNVDFDSQEMLYLYKILDFCEEENIVVDLSFYGCCSTFGSIDGQIRGSWLGWDYQGHWITAPKTVDENGNPFPGHEEFAESVYAALKFLVDIKGYTCIQEFSVFPEPNLACVDENGQEDYDAYVSIVRTIDAKLKKENIRDCAKFLGPADAATFTPDYSSWGYQGYHERYIQDLKDVYDKVTGSTYRWKNNSSNQDIYNFAKAFIGCADKVGLDWGLSEFGTESFQNDPDGSIQQATIDSYDRAVWIGRYMINFVNAGCTDMKLWILGDVKYGADYLMSTGLWQFRDKDWAARPQYYTWSLIMKYTEVGSDIYPIQSEDGDVCMVAFRLPDGSWSYMMANMAITEKKVSIVNHNENAPDEMDYYEVSYDVVSSLDVNNVRPLGSIDCLFREKGAISLTLKPNSFILLSTK